MKKLIVLNTALLALALSGCGKSSSHESGSGSTTAPTQVAPVPPSPTGSPSETPVVAVGKDPADPTSNPDPLNPGSGTNHFTDPQGPGVCKTGPIGTYNGYIKRADGSLVPLQLSLDIRKSGDSGTPLRASLRVGFLGGVVIGTESVVYKIPNSFLSVTFAGTASNGASASASSSAGATASATGGAPSVQIIGTLTCGTLVGGKIHGAKSGDQNIVLSKTEKSLFDDTKKEFNYALSFASHPENSGYLTITPRLSGFASSDTTDLPYLPFLTATIKYSGYGVTVEPFDYTLYDPLTNTIELSFANYGIFKCPLITKDLKTANSSPALICDVIMGASIFDQATGTSIDTVPEVAMRPPHYFKGFFYPSATLKYVAVASLDYQDRDAKNPVASIFPNFPVLDMKVSICDGSNAIARATYETVSINPINSRAIFRFAKLGNESFDMNVTYGPDFKTFTGEVAAAQTSPGAQNARYEFSSLADQTTWRTCATE